MIVVIIYMISRKFHPDFGIPGTEVTGNSPMEIAMKQGRGWEWLVFRSCIRGRTLTRPGGLPSFGSLFGPGLSRPSSCGSPAASMTPTAGSIKPSPAALLGRPSQHLLDQVHILTCQKTPSSPDVAHCAPRSWNGSCKPVLCAAAMVVSCPFSVCPSQLTLIGSPSPSS